MPSKNPSKKALPLKNLLRTLLRSVRLHDPLGVHPTLVSSALPPAKQSPVRGQRGLTKSKFTRTLVNNRMNCLKAPLSRTWASIRTGPTITSPKRVKDEKVYKPHFSPEFGGFSLEKVGEFRLNPCSRTKFANLPDLAMRWLVHS